MDATKLYQTLTDALRIDRHALDKELISLPHRFHEVAQAQVMAISRRDRARDDREQAKAKASLRIRAALERAGGKVTEGAVAADLALDLAVIHTEAAVRDAAEDHLRWEALEKAWQMRSYALKDLVVLHVKSYDQNPTSTVGTAKVARDLGDRDNRAIKKEGYKPLQDRARPTRESL